MDLNINYEDVSVKCSPNDYDFTSFIQDKLFRDQTFLEKIPFEGHYDFLNYDSSELKSDASVVTRRRGEKFTKEVIESGSTVTKNFYRYTMMIPISHGLSQGQILPAGVHVRLTFHRANARKALVDISNSVIEFGSFSIPLLEPMFHGCWSYGPKLDSQMGKVRTSGITIPFESAHIRHRVLEDGLLEHRIEIIQGPMPEYLVFFLMEPERFASDFKLSSTKMQMHELDEFSLILDNVVQEGYPLKVIKRGKTKFYHEFYRRWLMETESYGDSDQKIMDEKTYIGYNFMIVENFRNFESNEGNLAVKLKFETVLSEKLFLAWMPCSKKELKFDRNMSVQMI